MSDIKVMKQRDMQQVAAQQKVIGTVVKVIIDCVIGEKHQWIEH